jgi:hypothetical protein
MCDFLTFLCSSVSHTYQAVRQCIDPITHTLLFPQRRNSFSRVEFEVLTAVVMGYAVWFVESQPCSEGTM